MGFYDKVLAEEKINLQGGRGATVQIVELDKLKGCSDYNQAERMFYLTNSGVKLRLIRVILKNYTLKTESGALYYLKGNIKANVNMNNMTSKIISNTLTGEAIIKPTYTGTGEVLLEPSFKHFTIITLNKSSIIVNKGVYYASVGDIKISPASTGSTSAKVLGGDGYIQTMVSGTGIVVLNIPVPLDEIVQYKLNNEELKVDGNFCILRSGSLSHTIEQSADTALGSILGNEGVLSVFRGSGVAWVAPTAPIYEVLKWSNVNEIPEYGKNSRYNSKGASRSK